MDIAELKKLLPKDKHDDSNIEGLFSLSDADIEPLIPELLEWLQDMNWSVSEKIADVLSYRYKIAEPYVIALLSPSQSDEIWKYWLIKELIPKFGSSVSAELSNAVRRISESPTDSERAEEVDTAAKDYLFKL